MTLQGEKKLDVMVEEKSIFMILLAGGRGKEWVYICCGSIFMS